MDKLSLVQKSWNENGTQLTNHCNWPTLKCLESCYKYLHSLRWSTCVARHGKVQPSPIHTREDNRVSPNQREHNTELYHKTNTYLKCLIHQPSSTFIKFIIFPIFPLDRISFTCLLWRQDLQFQAPLKSLPFGSWWPHKWQAKAWPWPRSIEKLWEFVYNI